ncbi:MAG: ATP-binding protein [Thomasclavelia sp.]|nr:ATP-binding protein [Thomasclavelia sp.]
MNKGFYTKITLCFILMAVLYAVEPKYTLVYLLFLFVALVVLSNSEKKEYEIKIDETARDKENIIKEVEDENEYHNKILTSLIKTMHMPMVFIDKAGVIRFTNEAFRKAFNFEHLRGEKYQNIFEGQLLNIVEQSYVFENRVDTVMLINNRFYQIASTPIFKDERIFDGSIILFTDVSQVKEIEQMQSQFFSDVSHELKTPMSAIIGSVEILKKDGIKDQKTFDEFMDILLNESYRMQNTINDILKLVSIEQPKSKPDIQSTNVNDLIVSCINLFEPLASEKDIKIKYHNTIDKEVKIDYSTLKTSINNLLSNAIKYSNSGTITLDSKIKNDKIQIKVQDEGIGIDAKDLPYIFDRFYQVDDSRSNKDSTGLGLSIVKKMVEKAGGTIKVESVLDSGSIFKITLPYED